jgi:hypothetical protein
MNYESKIGEANYVSKTGEAKLQDFNNSAHNLDNLSSQCCLGRGLCALYPLLIRSLSAPYPLMKHLNSVINAYFIRLKHGPGASSRNINMNNEI